MTQTTARLAGTTRGSAARKGALRSLRFSPALLPLIGIVGCLLVWQLLPIVGIVREQVFPTATTVLLDIPHVLADENFFRALATSGTWWGLGLAVGVSLGIVIGTLMGRSHVIFLMLNPILAASYATPKVALVVPLVLLFGVNEYSMGGVVLLGALVPVVTASFQGASRVNDRYIWSARSLGVSDRMLLWRVVLPSALPDILSGIRIALGFTIVTLLGAEFVIRQGGVGAYLYNNLDLGQYVRVWSIGFLLAAFGATVDFLYVRLVSTTFRWIGSNV